MRALFVENMTKDVMQMLGTKYVHRSIEVTQSQTLYRYNIEPFFFSSSTNWIPSRYQESMVPKESDREYTSAAITFYCCTQNCHRYHCCSSIHSFDSPDSCGRNSIAPASKRIRSCVVIERRHAYSEFFCPDILICASDDQIIDTQSPLYLNSCR